MFLILVLILNSLIGIILKHNPTTQ